MKRGGRVSRRLSCIGMISSGASLNVIPQQWTLIGDIIIRSTMSALWWPLGHFQTWWIRCLAYPAYRLTRTSAAQIACKPRSRQEWGIITVLTPSRKADNAGTFSLNGVGRGFRVAVTGSTWWLRDLRGYYGVYMVLTGKVATYTP